MISNHLKQLAQLTLKSRPLRITNVSHRIGRHPVCKSATNNATAYKYRPSVNQSYRKMMSDPGTVRSFTMTTPVSRILDATFPLFTKPLDRIASLETLSSKYSQWFERYIRIRNHSVSNYIPDLSCGKLTESLLIPKRNGPVGWIARKLKMFWLILTPAQKRVFICSRCSPTPMNPKFIILGKVMEYRTTDTSANNSRTEPLHFEASYLIVDDVSSAQILKSVSAVIASPSMSQQKPAIGNSKNSYSSYWQLMINRLSAFQKAVVRSTTAFLAVSLFTSEKLHQISTSFEMVFHKVLKRSGNFVISPRPGLSMRISTILRSMFYIIPKSVIPLQWPTVTKHFTRSLTILIRCGKKILGQTNLFILRYAPELNYSWARHSEYIMNTVVDLICKGTNSVRMLV